MQNFIKVGLQVPEQLSLLSRKPDFTIPILNQAYWPIYKARFGQAGDKVSQGLVWSG